MLHVICPTLIRPYKKTKEISMESRKIYTIEELQAIEAEIRAGQSRAEWELQFDYKGNIVCSARNFRNIISDISVFGEIRFNELKNAPEKKKKDIITPWTDADDANLRQYIEAKYGIYNKQKYDDGMKVFLEERRYHPIRDYISGFEWDGQDRIHTFLTKYMLADGTAYTREVSRLIFAGGIHRLYNPGCKFDVMPVLIGTHQGEGKSTIVRWLATKDEYFSEVADFEGQKGIEALEGSWINEVSELLALTKTKDQEAVKSFLTRQNDRYRMPFDKRVSDHPRQCIFIGTTNKEQFLTDKTGNRRFYPVRVSQTGSELYKKENEVRHAIEQCWAQAKALYDAGKLTPYADPEMQDIIFKRQSDATEDDYRTGVIRDFLETREEVCIPMLWYEALKMKSDSRPTKRESNDIALIMQGMTGWERQETPKHFKNYGTQRFWKHTFIEI